MKTKACILKILIFVGTTLCCIPSSISTGSFDFSHLVHPDSRKQVVIIHHDHGLGRAEDTEDLLNFMVLGLTKCNPSSLGVYIESLPTYFLEERIMPNLLELDGEMLNEIPCSSNEATYLSMALIKKLREELDSSSNIEIASIDPRYMHINLKYICTMANDTSRDINVRYGYPYTLEEMLTFPCNATEGIFEFEDESALSLAIQELKGDLNVQMDELLNIFTAEERSSTISVEFLRSLDESKLTALLELDAGRTFCIESLELATLCQLSKKEAPEVAIVFVGWVHGERLERILTDAGYEPRKTVAPIIDRIHAYPKRRTRETTYTYRDYTPDLKRELKNDLNNLWRNLSQPLELSSSRIPQNIVANLSPRTARASTDDNTPAGQTSQFSSNKALLVENNTPIYTNQNNRFSRIFRLFPQFLPIFRQIRATFGYFNLKRLPLGIFLSIISLMRRALNSGRNVLHLTG